MTEPTPLIIDSFECLPVRLDFRMGVSHSLASRSYSENCIVIAQSSEGIAGFGESVPRSYVTGESTVSVMSLLPSLCESFKGKRYAVPDDLVRDLISLGASETADNNPSAFCALEIALIDLAGKHWSLPAADIIGISTINRLLRYSLIAPLMPVDVLRRFLESIANYGFKHIKIKVDDNDPSARVDMTREIVGDKVGLRVDANCSWTRSNAPGFMKELADRGIEGVEQPLAADDYEGMGILRGNGCPPIVLDESVGSIGDLERAVAAGSCDIVNVRISKCGGIIRSSRLIGKARSYGLGIQIGAQVGESCILTLAGACLASSVQSLVWLEGCYGLHLLFGDLCTDDVRFGPGGRYSFPEGPGFGVSADSEKVREAASRLRS